jgi:putative ubiquitin-RnfH superfamily antitoxin RatB of RatAB toxin-antitoxin module
MADKTPFTVEVIYAMPDVQRCVTVELRPGATLRSAIERSGILLEFPQIDLQVNRVGVFGELRELDDHVDDGDRIEIYRPLRVDPKEARRRKVARS